MNCELVVKVYLINDVPADKSGWFIGNLINNAMLKDSELSKLHKRNNLKHYCFSGLYPIETDYTYKANGIYNFILRATDEELLFKFGQSLSSARNENFIVLSITYYNKNWDNVKAIKTVTPIITSACDENGKQQSLVLNKAGAKAIKDKMFFNLSYKYKKLNEIEFATNFDVIFEDIIINPKVNYPKYKNIMLIGYKATLYFKDNQLAKAFAKIALTEGIGEKNSSCGAGFGQVIKFC